MIITYIVWNKTLESIFQITRGKVPTKYVMGVRSNNFTAAFFVSFIVTVFVPDVEEFRIKSYVYEFEREVLICMTSGVASLPEGP